MEDGIYKTVTAGTVTWEPYEEYYKVIEATDEVLFDEVCCYEEKEILDILKTGEAAEAEMPEE